MFQGDLFSWGPETREREFVIDIAGDCFKEFPKERVWEWAAREVWIGERMAAKPRLYAPEDTPWTKEWQELPTRPEVRLGVAMKDSRSGFTEASLNVMRWMPGHWPGGALYAINSQEKAREVCEKRVLATLPKAEMTGDPDDETLSKITLRNMEIVFSGSGSAGPFMEAWYRLIILDELENHVQNQDTTTLQRALSRQTDVPDGLTLAMSKPEEAGGIIDMAFISGTQKKFKVPCPRCGRRIELLRKFLVYSHCKDGDDSWDLARVLKETYYSCQLCGEPIYEKEKRAMVNAGVWVATPAAERRKPPSGQYVPADPSVESYHISSYYSLHDRSTWGHLAREILTHEVLNPTPEGKKYVRTNFDGLPYEDELFAVTSESIQALKAGHVEEVTEKTADGEEVKRRRVLAPMVLLTDARGQPRDHPTFKLAYINGKMQAPLPFKPAILTLFTDKQLSYLKYLVRRVKHH